MTTFRTFPNSVAAGIALAVLLDHDIPCELADVNAHLYCAAGVAIPVRLLVPEEYVEAATRILDSTDLSLPADFDPTQIE